MHMHMYICRYVHYVCKTYIHFYYNFYYNKTLCNQGVSQKVTIEAVRPQLGIYFCPAVFFSLILIGLNCPPQYFLMGYHNFSFRNEVGSKEQTTS